MASEATFDLVSVPRTRTRAIGDRLALGGAFADAARRYWTAVFPRVCRERSHWRERAGAIPDPALRALAREAQRKRGNVEGAAAFATFAPRAERAALVRALVAFQTAYDYLDVLAEQPQADPVAGARALHEALLVALDPARGPGLDGGTPRDGGQPDYYAGYPQREDGSYLAELIDRSRTALAALPSYAAVAPAARRGVERIVAFQSLNLSEAQGEHDAFAKWARAEIPAGTGLRWWEAAGAGGSPLCVYALLAAAAEPAVDAGEVMAVENAYFPWIGGLHSLLDHLVDRAQDAASGQRNLIDYYAGPREAAERMRALAERAAGAARALPRGRRHEIVLAGMVGYYLSAPEASATDAAPIARNVRAAIGGPIAPALLVFRARSVAERTAGARSGVSTAEAGHGGLTGRPPSPGKRPPPTLAARTPPTLAGMERSGGPAPARFSAWLP